MRWSALALMMLTPSVAYAQDEPPETQPETQPESQPESRAPPPPADAVGLTQVMNVARSKAERGLTLYAAKQWKEAYEHFDVANQLFWAPTLVMYMGHCKREQGELLAARDHYRRVATARVPSEAPAAYLEAQKTAQAELEKLAGRIPQVRIVVSGMPKTQVKVTLDGKPAPLDPIMIDVDPGPHVIDARGPRAEPVERRIAAVEGQVSVVQIALAPIAPERVVTTVEVEGPPVGLAPPIVFAGVGVAGFVVGAITGSLVLSDVADLEAACGGFRCPVSFRDQHDDIKPLATASTIGFVVGGIGVATAAVLFPLHFFGGDDPVNVTLGPGGMELGGVF